MSEEGSPKAREWRVVTGDSDAPYSSSNTRIQIVMAQGGKAWNPSDPADYIYSDDGEREATARYASVKRWAVREILAPGELSREEEVAAWRELYAADRADVELGQRARGVRRRLHQLAGCPEGSAWELQRLVGVLFPGAIQPKR